MPVKIPVGLPSPPGLQTARDQLWAEGPEASGGFCTVPTSLPQPTCPVPFLGACSKPCSLDLDGFPLPPKPFLCFKSCFLSDLFQQVFPGTPRGTSPPPLLNSWRAVYFNVELGFCAPLGYKRWGLRRQASGRLHLGVPMVACLVLRLESAGCTFNEHIAAARLLCAGMMLGSESRARHRHGACVRICD